MRILVTGGGGFLGSHLVERLESDGDDVFVARSADYDLTTMDDTPRLFADAGAELVFHLAAVVGGIGANRANPGRFWSTRTRSWASQLIEAAPHRLPKFVTSAPSAPTRSSRPSRSPRTTSGTATRRRRTRRTASPRRCCLVQVPRPTASSTASTRSSCSRPTCTGRGDNFDPQTSHVIPALIRKMRRAARATRSCSGATARRRASSCTSTTAPRRPRPAAERYDGAARSTSAPARRSRSVTWRT